jgi:hypothetical protein
MAIAIEGAVIVKEHEGAYTSKIVYKRRCENCGYLPPQPPISVSCLPYETQMYGSATIRRALFAHSAVTVRR